MTTTPDSPSSVDGMTEATDGPSPEQAPFRLGY